jgi:hypothetical protein
VLPKNGMIPGGIVSDPIRIPSGTAQKACSVMLMARHYTWLSLRQAGGGGGGGGAV